MPDKNRIVRERQLLIRRQLDERHASLKGIAADAQMPMSTLLSYFPAERDKEPATIGGAALFALCLAARAGSFPADLLSWLLPEGFQIVAVPDGIDHDALCAMAQDYVDTKMAAHRADSPGGPVLVTTELDTLAGKAGALRAAT